MLLRRLLVSLVIIAGLIWAGPATADTGRIERVSVRSDGTEGNNLYSERSAISDDGRYVAFHSSSSRLHPSDDSIRPDVYRFDRLTRTLDLVSVDGIDRHTNAFCGFSFDRGPSISANGDTIAFECMYGLTSEDNNGGPDIYVRTISSGSTVLVPSFDGNAYEPALSGDGRFVAFRQTIPGTEVKGIYRHDLTTRTTELVSVAMRGGSPNDDSFDPSISSDGHIIAFSSVSTDLVATDANGATRDVFVRDMATGTTHLVSVGDDGAQSPFGLDTGHPVISGDGTRVAFASEGPLEKNDLNVASDIYVRDLQTSKTMNASYKAMSVAGVRDPSGCCGVPSLSRDGRFVSFTSSVMWPPPPFGYPVRNPLDPFVYVYDTTTHSVVVASLTPSGARFAAREPALSGDGRFLSLSAIDDVADGDSNRTLDIYVIDRTATLGTCSNGGNESGILSKRIHELGKSGLEPDALHELNCSEVVGPGL